MEARLLLLILAACGPDPAGIVYTTDDLAPLLEHYVATLPDALPVPLRVEAHPDPARAARRGALAVLGDGADPEGYRIDADGKGLVVHGGAPLGVQYGLSAVLEARGLTFVHPEYTEVAADYPHEVDPALLGVEHTPAVARRGLHLHTLHPIEAYAAFWESGDEDRAERVMDWLIRNRGDHLQWVALDDISDAGQRRADWAEHTGRLIDAAHARGLTTGIGIQLFGSSNLQQAFDLLDRTGDADTEVAAIDARLAEVGDGLDWDLYSLSFGEFSGVTPETFIESVDRAYDRMQAQKPGIEVAATIHVGNNEDLQVEYQGEELQYYFLVKYTNPAIVPWVHSVMYYDLYEPTGGAYGYPDGFDDHRAFLEDRLAAGQPVGYHPESAYWVAFDDSVPQWFPLYVRSRWLDLSRTVPQGLADHVLFSTGWEWGYWQNDAATLRMTYEVPDDYATAFSWLLPPDLADVAVAVAEAQHDAMIDHELAAYVAGRDLFIDLGDNVGIYSQPDRPSYDEVAAFDEAQRAAFVAEVLDPLAAYADTLAGLSVTRGSPLADEMADGLAIDLLRARYQRALYGCAVGEDNWAEVEATLADAHAVVSGRAWLDPEGDRWVAPAWDTATIYDYGYLHHADELCFWERELAQAKNALLGATETVDGCGL